MIPGDKEQIVTKDEEQLIPEDQECHIYSNSENDTHSSQSIYMYKYKQILSMYLLLYLDHSHGVEQQSYVMWTECSSSLKANANFTPSSPRSLLELLGTLWW